ncbi:MAG: rod shape-determining protein RodA [Gammaproteobacteria bacterium]|nr:rod shape-determining protein RodA [Gammaproteobacteria bacterium]MCK5263182.1 rod shape-determining protein RodA [Gammaproteobacteria bacterium]
MNKTQVFEVSYNSRLARALRVINIDPILFLGIFLLTAAGLGILYSAGDGSIALVRAQLVRLGLAFFVMVVVAQIPQRQLYLWAPWFFALGIILLILVLTSGDVGKGAQRWLDLYVIKFQPSEMMKLITPMMLAWYLSERPLPPTAKSLLISAVLVIVPTVLIASQPDLGTSILVAAAGFFVVFLAGLRWRVLLGVALAGLAFIPVLWQLMHDYQKQRVLTLLDPESDPLGSGYHIIQSKIAIGSGGIYGKGWLNGTQSQLDFLPERHTDFIFAVFAEEFGMMGAIVLLSLYVFIILRSLYIASRAQDSFGRLLAGSLGLTFFVYLFVNVGMVSGILPVVGVPLPLVSYGGTSMVTLMAGFGMLMSINSNRRLLSR